MTRPKRITRSYTWTVWRPANVLRLPLYTCSISSIIRPPDIVVGGLGFYRDSSFSSSSSSSIFFSSATLRARWTELKPKPATCSKVSAIWECMSEIWVWRYPHSIKIGGPNPPFFRRLHNLTANLTAYIFRAKYYIHNRANALEIARGLLHRENVHEHWSTSGLKLDLHFYPPSVNYAFYFIATLRRRTSANRTQPNFAKRWTVNCANNLPEKSLGRPSQNNSAPKKRLHLFGFSTTLRLKANIFSTNRARMWESTRGPLRCAKISWCLVHKRLKVGPEPLPTLSILSRPQSISLSSINVTPHGECKWNGTGFVCSSDSKPQKDYNLAVASRRRPKWQCIVNCHHF